MQPNFDKNKQAFVATGFRSPADDFLQNPLDLNQLLIKHPAATFFVRAKGEAMIEEGIEEADILVVDRSLEPVNGKIIVAVVNGEFVVRKIYEENHRLFLFAANKNFQPIEITEDIDFLVWGVVTSIIKQCRA